MENPFPKPPGGSYREPLINGLRLLGKTAMADYVEKGTIRLAVLAQLDSRVKTAPGLVPLFIEALTHVPGPISGYYQHQLQQGIVVPGYPGGAYVYQPDNPESVAAMEQAKAAHNSTPYQTNYYAPGELFLKS